MSIISASNSARDPDEQVEQLEKERLECLRSYHIVDTSPEIEFDRITDLASKIAGTKVAVISFVEQDRQWFKSKVGIEAQGTPREIAFCHHTIQNDELMIVSDATRDIRFKNNPLVKGDPHIRFYAGAPLISKKGYRLGTLCVFDSQKVELDENQQNALVNLANQVMSLMELRKYQEDVEHYQELLHKSAKLSVLGEMSASLAHEINNPLSVVMGHASELLNDMTKDPTMKPEYIESVTAILNGAQRISNITKGVKSYSLNSPIENMEPHPLHKILFDTVNIFTKTKDQKSITFLCDFRSAENVLIHCHPSMLGQVILNLLNNAYEAITELEKKWVRMLVEVDEKNEKIFIRVSDSGNGIKKDVAQKIMEPFFTTKSKQMGTGLGLSISTKIAKAHGGELYLNEDRPHTTFTLELPYPLTKQ